LKTQIAETIEGVEASNLRFIAFRAERGVVSIEYTLAVDARTLKALVTSTNITDPLAFLRTTIQKTIDDQTLEHRLKATATFGMATVGDTVSFSSPSQTPEPEPEATDSITLEVVFGVLGGGLLVTGVGIFAFRAESKVRLRTNKPLQQSSTNLRGNQGDEEKRLLLPWSKN